MKKKEPGSYPEPGLATKDWGGRFPLALAYPNRYATAISNLGFQTIYLLLNREVDFVAERFYFNPDPDKPLRLQESGRPPTAAPVIIFSISFESDYLNLVLMLRRLGLDPRAAGRGSRDPLILAGGIAVSINPLPLMQLVDGFLLGEGESQIPVFLQTLRTAAGSLKADLAAALVLVPGFLDAGQPLPVALELPRAPVDELVPCSFVRGTGPQIFAENFLLEVNRGCPRGCRFCAAGFVYRPFRNRSLAGLWHTIEQGHLPPGSRIGLVGSALGDYPGLRELCRGLLARDLGFSFSSLRIDTVDDELLELLTAGGVRSLTIAPEAGSARLRRALRKGLEEGLMLERAARVAAAGIGRLKLYFLIGLPGEEAADLQAIVDLVGRIRQVMLEKRRLSRQNIALQVSVNPLIPKPGTPLQWAPFMAVSELKKRQKFLRLAFARQGGVELEMEPPEAAAWQARLSRGGPDTAELLLAMAAAGSRKSAWRRLLAAAADELGERRLEQTMPWDFLRGMETSFLVREFQDYHHQLGGYIV